MENPVLITGTFRSGTTLITQIMDNHPRLSLVYDSVNFMRFSYNKFDPLTDFSNVEALVTEIRERIEERWDMEFDAEKVLSELRDKEVTYSLIYNSIMSELLLVNTEAEIWGEKTTLVWTKIPGFFDMFPEGRVIHIIRDPRAIVASWRKMTHAPGNDYLDSIYNCKGSMEKMRQYEKDFEEKRYAAVKFEDLVKFPHRAVRKICADLDLAYEKNILNTTYFTDKSGEDWQGNSMFREKLQGISTDTIDTWKEKLEPWEVWLTEFFTSDLMDIYNYEKKNIKLQEKLLDKLIQEVQSSNLVTNGALYYLFAEEGLERFPSDPLDAENWE